MEPFISTNQKIINTLLLNASFIDNLGLMHGKMGISIFFYHLSRQTGDKIYEDYAGELIDEIYEEITANTPVDFENGLAGIGWGIEYLVQNDFIEADTDDVLEEFDNRIFKELIYNTPKDIGLLYGLTGLGAYFLKRVQNPISRDERITTLTNQQTLIHLIDELERQTQNITKIISEPLSSSNNHQTFKQLSNPRTTKQQIGAQRPNDHRNRSDGTVNETFDLTLNYPTLLWFLTELHEQNIFNFKVEKIIQRLTKPLSNESNLPKLQSNRLLLALALTKLQQTTNYEPRTTNKEQQTTPEQSSNALRKESYGQTIIEPSNLQTIINNLLTGINRNTINSELPPNNATLRYGTPGIAWIYQQLHRQTHDNHFKEEMEYWTNQTDKSGITNEVFTEADTKKSYGILEGLSGILLLTEIRRITETIETNFF